MSSFASFTTESQRHREEQIMNLILSVSVAQVRHVHLHRFGEDFAAEGYVRDPYGE